MEHQSPTRPSWFALRVRTRCEKVVDTCLSQRDVDRFLPLYKKQTQWSDRVRTSFVPLFPGYVFARFSREGLHRVCTIPDFMYIVGRGSAPEPLEEEEIVAVKRLVADGAGVGPWPFCTAGQLVEVIRGPLAGLRGGYVRAKSESRLIISLPLLQRSVATEVESYNVRVLSTDYRVA